MAEEYINKIKIFVSRRIDVDSFEIEGDLYCQVECGSIFNKTKSKSGSLFRDCDGINVSNKRSSLGELTVQYWAWKNFNLDYYGLCHYRRFLVLSKNNFKKNCQNLIVENFLDECSVNKYNLQDSDYVHKLASKFRIIINESADVSKIPTPKGQTFTVYDHWVAHGDVFLRKESLDLLLLYIKDYKPKYYKSALLYLKGGAHRGYNCFILEKTIFEELCEFQFEVLFNLEKVLQKKGLLDNYPRTLGYLGEIMYGIFIFHKVQVDKIKFKELPLVYFEYTEKTPLSKLNNFFLKFLITLKVNKETQGFKLLPKNSVRRKIAKRLYFFLLNFLKR